MKMFRFMLLTGASVAMAFMLMGCGNDDPVEKNTDPVNTDPGDAGPGDSDELDFGTRNCDPDKICANLEHPEDCIGTFGLGTAQAGSDAEGVGYETHVGFYGYNDRTEGGVEIPAPNNEGSEDAYLANRTCESAALGKTGGDFALHVYGTGFDEWGFGVGVDWGGPDNPDCYDENGEKIPGGFECLQVFQEDSNFLIADAEKDPRCQDEDGNPDPSKMRCCIWVKKYKVTRDLSAYKGIGFWVARFNPDSKTTFQINFGVPESTRFYKDPAFADGEKYEKYQRREGVGPEMDYSGGCSDDDGVDSTKCYNDFSYIFNLPTELGQWTYVEILFEDLAFNEYWGLQLPFDKFPKTRSIGFKLQTPSLPVEKEDLVDFYLDDVHFIR